MEDLHDESNVVNVQSLSAVELIDRLEATVTELRQRKERLVPTTDAGRELHSIRTACLIELARRGLR